MSSWLTRAIVWVPVSNHLVFSCLLHFQFLLQYLFFSQRIACLYLVFFACFHLKFSVLHEAWLYVLNKCSNCKGKLWTGLPSPMKRLIGLIALCRQIPICLQLLIGAHNWLIITGEVFSKTVSSFPPFIPVIPSPHLLAVTSEHQSRQILN